MSLAAQRPASVAAVLGILAAVVALALWRSSPPPPRGADTPAGEFAAARALEFLDRLLGDGAPHPVGSAEHENVRERLLAEIRALGLAPRVEESLGATRTSIAVARNVVARLDGREDGKAVLVCAHYDSVAAGPGAGDDGAGVATALEIARALSTGEKLRRPVVFLFTDAEEAGLVGADAYARAHPVAAEIEVVVNLEARGTEGRSYLFETSTGNADLVRLYARAVSRPCATSAAYEVYKRMPNDTDLSVFKRHGVAGFNFSFIGGLPRYHTPRDDRAHLSAASVQHQGDQALALVRALASEEVEPRAEDDSVYADVLGATFVRWPASASMPVALAVLAALAAFAVLGRRREPVAIAAVGRGALLYVAVTAAGALAALAVARGLGALRGTHDYWVGDPRPSIVATAACTLAACAFLARAPFLRRAGASGSWTATWLLLAIAGVFAAKAAAGASYLFLLPCGAAVLARALPSRAARALLPASVLAVFWIPLSVGLFEAVELAAPVAIGLPIGAVLAASMPALVGGDPRSLARLARAAALACAAALAWAGLAPAQTTDRPAHCSLQHVQEADGTTRVYVSTFGRPLPCEIAAVGMYWDELPEPPFPGVRALPSGFSAVGKSADSPPPDLRVTAEARAGAQRILDLHVASARGAPMLVLQAKDLLQPEAAKTLDAGVLQVAWRGQRVERPLPMWASWTSRTAPDGRQLSHATWLLAGAGAEGFDVKLRAPADLPIELLLLDVSPGLPESSAAAARARPADHVPIGTGDVTVVARRVSL